MKSLPALFAACSLAVSTLPAQTFTGTNQTDTFSDVSILVGGGQAGLAVETTNNTGGTFSQLYLKAGGGATESNFDFSAESTNGAQNTIYLEPPELVSGSYSLRIKTPFSSTAHAFNVVATANPAGLRSASKPVSKPVTGSASGMLTAGNYHYFRVDLPAGLPGWRAVLTGPAAGSTSLFILRNAIPNISFYDRAATDQVTGTVTYTAAQLDAGSYYLAVYVPAGVVGSVNYQLNFETTSIPTLDWDPGSTHLGTQTQPQPNTIGGDYYFKVTTQATTVGAWRTALNVTSGSASIHLRFGSLPSVTANGTVISDHSSTQPGSNGFVLGTDQFAPAQDWYYVVRASAGAQWNLVSGEAFVQDLGLLAEDASSGSGPVVMGAEGVRYFRTTTPAGTLAWVLWLNGAVQDLYVRKNAVPTFANQSDYDLRRAGGHLLAVPPYLGTGSAAYFVAFPGTRGATYQLHSRIQPITDLAFNSTTPITAAGTGYQTFRVQVPVQQIAWEPRVTPGSGSASLALRQGDVPNEDRNAGFSEIGGGATNSVTVSPPTLTNGTWYLTVYGTGSYTATLSSGQPVVTDINFTSTSVNDAPAKAGWRFYRLSDINQQLGQLGWDLFLQNFAPGTEIALRRNAVPSRQNFRDGDQNPGISINSLVDYSGIGFLQRPGHQADIWYVGVYQPSQPLGTFTLQTLPLAAPPVAFDAGSVSINSLPAGKWAFYSVTVPSGPLGWDVRVTGVSGSGFPRLVIRRDQLPDSLSSSSGGWPGIGPVVNYATGWPSGNQWAAREDWTNRTRAAGSEDDVRFRILAMGTGCPLESGTYFIGVYNSDANSPFSCTLQTRGIGSGQALTVPTLGFAGGSAGYSGLAPREALYYRVAVPANTVGWKLKLSATSGEALLLVNRDRLPSVLAPQSSGNDLTLVTPNFPGGVVVQKRGDEHFAILPGTGQDYLPAGDYYLAVVAEGQSPSESTRTGTGTCSGTIQSLGALVPSALGTVGAVDLVSAESLAGGEARTFQFVVPASVVNVEVRLENVTGKPRLAVISGPRPASAVSTSYFGFRANDYGANGGQMVSQPAMSDSLVSLANPTPGTYSVTVQAGFADGETASFGGPGDSIASDATYTLRVVNKAPLPLAFDGPGNSAVVTNQPVNGWQYFQVTVPPGALGWDVRIFGVNAGVQPKLVVRRDLLPESTTTSNSWPGVFPLVFSATGWPSGNQWATTGDWTGRSFDENGEDVRHRVMAMGLGDPLEPGTYFVGLYNSSSGPCTYTVQSRGIGAGYLLPVPALAFAGGSAPFSGLAPREAAYYRVAVPANTPGWRVRLDVSGGDALLLVNRERVPSVLAAPPSSFDLTDPSVTYPGGVSVQKIGGECYALLPAPGQDYVPAGDYFLAVVGEGAPADGSRTGPGAVSGTIQSLGALVPSNLGTVGVADLVANETFLGGETKTYQFTIPPGLSSVEVRLQNPTGKPRLSVLQGPRVPKPSSAFYFGYLLNNYGASGGEGTSLITDTLLSLANPAPGLWSVTVQAGYPDGQAGFFGPAYLTAADATCTLRVANKSPLPLAFDGPGSSLAISGQEAGSWQYFVVDVPPGALGWDVRLAGVSGLGSPALVVCRDQLPNSTNTSGGWPGASSTVPYGTGWPSGNQWAAGGDWTHRVFDAADRDVRRHLHAMGMGCPLEPGTYYVGVYNLASTEATSYTMQSRGIGTGYALAPTSLAFSGGTAVISNLAPREALYYRVPVPTNTPSWKLKLTLSGGDALLFVNRDRVPSTLGQPPFIQDLNESPPAFPGGVCVQKVGDEYFEIIPALGQTSVPAGDYYVAVIGEGTNPSDGSHTGAGTSSGTLQSLGSPSPLALGTVGGADLVSNETLVGGEAKTYRFSVPGGIPALEVRLDGVSGNPRLSVAPGTLPPKADSGFYFGDQINNYGFCGGAQPTGASSVLVPVPSPLTGTYSVTVQAGYPDGQSGGFGTTTLTAANAAFTLRVAKRDPIQLNFSASQNGNGFNNANTQAALDQQRFYYRVDIPLNSDGGPVVGWRLQVARTSGSTTVRVASAFEQFSDGTNLRTFADSATIVPPYLTPGTTWWVEVAASGATNFTLTSNPVLLQHPLWTMPAFGESITTPGPLDPSDFGDSGVAANGTVISPDRGTDLAANDFHYFAVSVPAGNGGLLRTRLDAISGNSDLYLRAGGVPTLSHNTDGFSGQPLIDHQLVNVSTSQTGNWVPLNGRFATELTPGTWYLAVRAGGSNARYRLHVSIGFVTAIVLNGATLSNQTMTGGDWRYYRFVLPTDAPSSVSFTFTQSLGGSALYLRDTLPPGEVGQSASQGLNYISDWNYDGKNQGPYPNYPGAGTYAVNTPPLRPGHVYYLGLRATSDSTFAISASAGPGVAAPPLLAFAGGHLNTSLSPGATATYRVVAPSDAVRFKYTSSLPAGVDLRIEQGTYPSLSGNVHYTSGGNPDPTLNQTLSPAFWPWQAGQTYYVTLVNTTGSTQNADVVFNGATFYTEDEDNDGVADWWEKQYFSNNIYIYDASGNPAQDGLPNLLKYALGLDPTRPQNALLPRAVIENGFLTLTVTKPAYPVSGLIYQIESAGNLGLPNPWSSATTTVLIDNGVTLKVRDNVPAAGARREIRLRLTRP